MISRNISGTFFSRSREKDIRANICTKRFQRDTVLVDITENIQTVTNGLIRKFIMYYKTSLEKTHCCLLITLNLVQTLKTGERIYHNYNI